MKQLSFFNSNVSVEFGGTLTGKRKAARPLNFKMPHHFVFKATDPYHLLKKKSEIEHLLKRFNQKFGVRMYSFAVHCDHIHLNVRLTSRLLYRRWIRALTACLVMKIPGLKFGFRPYSRIVSWGTQFRRLNIYIHYNREQAALILKGWTTIEALASPPGFLRI